MGRPGEERNLALLKKIPFLEPLDTEELHRLLPRLRERRCGRGEVLFHEGEPGHELYLVRSGQVKVYRLSEEGKEKILGVFGPGDFFAELPLLDGGRYPASAETLAQSILLCLRREDFLDVVGRRPEVLQKMHEIVGIRLRGFASMVTDLTLKDATRRLAGFLLDKAREYDLFAGDEVRFPLNLTHQEIASLIGTARETVSRTLGQFQQQGLIEIKDRFVTIRNRKALADRAR